jgi:hypothetical protein
LLSYGSDFASIQPDQPGSAAAENPPCHCLFFLLIYFAVEDEQTTVSDFRGRVEGKLASRWTMRTIRVITLPGLFLSTLHSGEKLLPPTADRVHACLRTMEITHATVRLSVISKSMVSSIAQGAEWTKTN